MFETKPASDQIDHSYGFVDGEGVSGIAPVASVVSTEQSRQQGAALRAHRVHTTRLNMAQAAELLGISVTALSSVELGKRVFVEPEQYRKAMDLMTLAEKG